MSQERKPVSVKIERKPDGSASILLDGHEISKVTSSVKLEWAAGQDPKVTVEVWAHEVLNLELEALVDVNVTHFYEGPR